MKKLIILIALLLNFSLISSSQQKPTVDFRVNFRDGNTINGTTQITKIDLTTTFGKLTFPIKNISSIVLGIQPDIANKEKFRKLINELNNPSEEARKKAYAELTSLEASAVPVIEQLVSDSVLASSTISEFNITEIISILKGKYFIENGYDSEDIITTDNLYRIGGISTLKDVSLKTEYGTLEIPKDKIKSIDVFYRDYDQNEAIYTLPANKYISGNTAGGWLKTNIYVKPGQRVSITATGEVTLASLSNAKYKPDGASATTAATYEGDYSYGSTYPTYGNLVYKVGEVGAMVKAGSKYNFVATQGGCIYLSIYETVYNANNSGNYNVKVKTNN